MAKLSSDDLLDAFKEMTLIELSDFVKQFEETFDVKAAAPVAVVGPAAGAGAGALGGSVVAVATCFGSRYCSFFRIVRSRAGLYVVKSAPDCRSASMRARMDSILESISSR